MPADKPEPPVILGRYAGFFSRGVAYALDNLISFGIAFVILAVIDFFLGMFQIDQWLASAVEDRPIYAGLALLLSAVGVQILVSFIYDIGFWMLSGQTPGKRVLGLRVMRADGTRLRFGNAVRRRIGYWVSSFFFLGFLLVLFDNKRQAFHDKLAGTIVTYSWPEGRLRGTFVIERVQRYTDRGS